MLQSYTHNEMLRLWRMRAGLDPALADCTVEAVEGLDADAVIAPRMRSWYLNLLDTARPELLPMEDIAAEMVLMNSITGTSVAVIPPRARRVIELRLSSWKNTARPVAPADDVRSHTLALNPYSAPGSVRPLCSVCGRRLYLSPAAPSEKLSMALAVVDPGAGTYTLDESLLEQIPDIFSQK